MYIKTIVSAFFVNTIKEKANNRQNTQTTVILTNVSYLPTEPLLRLQFSSQSKISNNRNKMINAIYASLVIKLNL